MLYAQCRLAAWSNPANRLAWVFATTADGISSIQINVVSSDNLSLASVFTDTTGGSSPILANGMLFYTSGGKAGSF
jgi:hypothetical protein